MDEKAEPALTGDERPGSPQPASRTAWIGLFALAIAVTLISLDMSVVTVANPAIGSDLNTTLAELQWVTSGYILAFAASLVTAGKLGDYFGHRRVFLIGMAGFMVSSALVGLAGSVESLIGWRVVQGICGAALMPSALAILRLTFPEERLKTAIGVFMGTYAIAGVSGPFVGGAIVQYANWRWAFFVNVFAGAVALIVVMLLVRHTPPEGTDRHFDVPGIVFMTVALVGLVWGIIRVPEDGWTGAQPLISLLAAVVFGVLFVLREQRAADPLIPLALFRSPPVVAGTAAVVIAGALMFASWFYVALYLQHVRGFTPVQAGLGLLPLAATTVVFGPVAGKLNERFGRRLPVLLGTLAMAAGFAGLTQVSAGSSYHRLWPFLLLVGAGMSTIYPVATEAIVSSAPPSLAGVSSGMSETAASIGPVFGIATLGSVLLASVNATLPERLTGAGVPPDVTARVVDGSDIVAQGDVPVPPGTAPALAETITEQAYESFVVGLQTSMTVAAVAVLAVVPLAVLMGSGRGAGAGAESTTRSDDGVAATVQ